MTLVRTPLTILVVGVLLACLASRAEMPIGPVDQLALAGVICALAAIAGKWPLRYHRRDQPERFPSLALVSMALRGGLTAGGLILMVCFGGMADRSTVLAAGLWYAAFLIAELILIQRHMADMAIVEDCRGMDASEEYR